MVNSFSPTWYFSADKQIDSDSRHYCKSPCIVVLSSKTGTGSFVQLLLSHCPFCPIINNTCRFSLNIDTDKFQHFLCAF